MNLEREKLIKLLKLVQEIAEDPKNSWFKNELIRLFTAQNHSINLDNFGNQSLIEVKINLIHDYLKIDYDNLIDYSEFDEPSREQLFRDNLEMLRFRKGTPNHKINFSEFCRYAHLQAEEMLNYFFNKVSNNKIHQVENFIKHYCSNYNPPKKPNEIHHIYYTSKLIAFRNSQKDFSKKTYDLLYNINDFRNESSHRNSSTSSSEDRDLINFEKEGFSKSSIDFKKATRTQIEIFNKGKYIIFKRSANFDEVLIAIEGMKNSILEALKNPPSFSSSEDNLGAIHPNLAALKKKLESD
jgi:hypothetical protein